MYLHVTRVKMKAWQVEIKEVRLDNKCIFEGGKTILKENFTVTERARANANVTVPTWIVKRYVLLAGRSILLAIPGTRLADNGFSHRPWATRNILNNFCNHFEGHCQTTYRISATTGFFSFPGASLLDFVSMKNKLKND